MIAVSYKVTAKKTIMFLVAVAVAIVSMVVAVRFSRNETGITDFGNDFSNQTTRISYLNLCGLDAENEVQKDIKIPCEFSQVYQKYNEIQKQQGFDLSDYRGKSVRLFRYTAGDFTAELIVDEDDLIAGGAFDKDGNMYALTQMRK